MRGNALEAARQLIWLDGLLDDPQQKLDNQYRIWEQLSTLTDQALEALRTSPPPDPLSGWMELLQITRQSHGNRQAWMQQLDNWRNRYPGHAAETALLPDLLGQVQQLTARPQHIAVLLPFTGRARESAAALRDGMLAAWYEEQPVGTTLRFYDTAGDAMLLWSVYQQAVEDGADFVIGPLLKESIAQLAGSGLLPVPVMALNQIGGEMDAELPLYQFGLAPEDEARQAAQRMFSDGHRYVISLIPDNPWGERVFTAFATAFGDLGGEVLETGRYPPKTADFKKPIERTLNLDDSKRRHNALQRLLGEKLNYEPRRRKDVEAIFILGFPRQARQLRPQLRFHHAGDLPVYSTSHVYAATSDPGLDRDMDGLMFCDIPWALDKSGRWAEKRRMLASIWPVRSKRFQRLFALGYDAWQVTPWLGTLNMPGFANYPGATGILTLDKQKRLHRTLEWAQFRRGVPNKLAHSDKPVSTEGRHESQKDRKPGGGTGL
jgi:outer membrane PBP1 activator LpoA protein